MKTRNEIEQMIESLKAELQEQYNLWGMAQRTINENADLDSTFTYERKTIEKCIDAAARIEPQIKALEWVLI